MEYDRQNRAPTPPSEPIAIRLHSRALATLALATGGPIATLLCIPDAIGFIPDAKSVVRWSLLVVTSWLTILIIWWVGFLSILHGLRFLVGAVYLTPAGLKIWRLGRLIPWTAMTAVSVEPQHVFSTIFGLNPPARRLTIYGRRAGGKIYPNYIPSFLFAENDFRRLFAIICVSAYGFIPDALNVLVSADAQRSELKKKITGIERQRLFISFVIALGLTAFLVRKSIVNYVYAESWKSFFQLDYRKAMMSAELATRIDPYHARAWDQLARSEFHLNEHDRAKEHYRRAIELNPLLVEPRVGLSLLYIQDRNFSKAERLLNSALKYSPRSAPALINMATLKMEMGDTREAVRFARFILSENPNNAKATCLLARGLTRMGHGQEAWHFLKQSLKSNRWLKADPFCKLVTGEVLLDLGKIADAQGCFNDVLAKYPNSADVLLDVAQLYMAQGRYRQAEDLLDRLCKLQPHNPWPWLHRVANARALKQIESARVYLARAVALEHQDAGSLARAAKLSMDFGLKQQALQLAERSRLIVPDQREAVAVTRSVTISGER